MALTGVNRYKFAIDYFDYPLCDACVHEELHALHQSMDAQLV